MFGSPRAELFDWLVFCRFCVILIGGFAMYVRALVPGFCLLGSCCCCRGMAIEGADAECQRLVGYLLGIQGATENFVLP